MPGLPPPGGALVGKSPLPSRYSKTGKYIGPRAGPYNPGMSLGDVLGGIDNFFSPVEGVKTAKGAWDKFYQWGHAVPPAAAKPLPKPKAKPKAVPKAISTRRNYSPTDAAEVPAPAPTKPPAAPAKPNVTVTPPPAKSRPTRTPAQVPVTAGTGLSSNDQLSALAQKMLNDVLGPLKDFYGQQAQYVTDQGANQIATQKSASDAIASLLGKYGDQVGNVYGDAANNIAGFAKGFTGNLAAPANAEAQSQADYLKNVVGAPNADAIAAKGNIAGLADNLYNQGGFMPATNLTEQGAAAKSAALKAPLYAAEAGADKIAGIGTATRDAQVKLAQTFGPEIAKVLAGKPDIMNALSAIEGRRVAADQNAQALDIKGKQTAATIQQGKARLQIARLNANTAADREARMQWYQQSSLDLRDKSLQLQAKKWLRALKEKGSFLGLRPKDYYGFVSQAKAAAARAHNGFTADDGTQHDPVSYLDYLRRGQNAKIPTPILIAIAQSVYSPEERAQGLIP